MKKLLFCLILAFFASIEIVFANYYHVKIGDLYYNLDTGAQTASLKSETDLPENYFGLTTINIPATVVYNDIVYSVTSIEENTFIYCDSLLSVTIPNSVISLAGAFSTGCSNLKTITVAEDNTAYCSVDGVLFNKAQTVLMNFPKGKQGTYAIPNTVTRVSGHSFYYCNGLTEVTIPNSVTSLEGAFYGCGGLTSVTIPNSVTRISSGEFCNCNSLTSINVAEDNTAYCSVDGVLFNKAQTMLLAFPGAKSGAYVIPEDVTLICQEAFSFCRNLESITIPSNVTNINGGAFEYCSGLQSITCKAIAPPTCAAGGYDYGIFTNSSFYYVDKSIPVYVPAESVEAYKAASQWKDFTNIQAIDEPESEEHTRTIYLHTGGPLFWSKNNPALYIYAWTGDKQYTNIKLQHLNNYLFSAELDEKYTNLMFVKFDSNTTSFDLSKKQSLTKEFTVSDTNDMFTVTCDLLADGYDDYADGYWSKYDEAKENLIAYGTCGDNLSWEINEQGVLEFSGSGNMNNYSFYYYTWSPWYGYSSLVKSIILPNNLTNIGSYAFSYFDTITTITIPGTVTAIGTEALNIQSLTSITCNAITPPQITSEPIGKKITHLGTRINKSIPLYVPAGSVNAYKSADYWKDFTNIQPIAEPFVFTNPVKIGDLYYNLDTIYYTAEVTYESYANNMYNKGWNITTADIPASVEYLGMNFDVTAIGEYAFYYCSKLTSVTIPNSVSTVGYAAFGNTGLTSIDIPGSVTIIGNRLCMSCSSLTAINVAEDNPTYHSIEGVLFKNTPMTLVACPVGKQGAFTVPDGVTSIQEWAFSYCTGLTAVTLPGSLTLIERDAFYGCTGLTKVEIPGDVTSIGDYAFAGCKALPAIDVAEENTSFCAVDGVLFNNDTTLLLSYPGGREGDYIIPDGVTEIRNAAFYECRNLKDLTISGSVTRIGNSAFRYCTGLTSITCEAVTPPVCNNSMALANIAESIPVYVPAESVEAYKNASVWKDFGDNIQAIGVPQEFVNPVKIGDLYYNLDTIYGTAEVTYEKQDDEDNYAALSGELIIPSIVEYRGLPYNVTGIGSLALYFCTGITSVALPNSVTKIDEWAFANCRGLTSVNLGSITTIGNSAFAYCMALNAVTIPASVSSIGNGAFEMCSSLSIVTCEATTPPSCGTDVFNRIATPNKLYVPAASILTYRLTSPWNEFSDIQTIIDPEKIENPVKIGDLYYNLYPENRTAKVTYQKYKATDNYAGLATANIPAVVEYGGLFFDVISIDDRAFHDCTSLSSVSIPNSVTSIGQFTFANCSGLKSIEIPNSVTKILTQAFAFCTGLTSIAIPNSVTELYGSSFGGCSNLKAINVASDNPAYYSVDGVVFNTNSQTAIIAFPGGKQESYDIPENVMHIAHFAFFNCSTLRSVTIPSSVKTIGDAAFLGCSGLTSITIPSSVQLIGDWAFENCTGLTSITSERTIPVSLTDGVFREVNKSIPVYVPAESVEAYKAADGWKDFGDNIQAIVVPQEIENPVKIGDLYYNLNAENKTAEVTYQQHKDNLNYSDLTIAAIPDSAEYNTVNYAVTSIGKDAFSPAINLTSVTISNSVISIGAGAFFNCSKLTSVTLGNSVTSIGGSAFEVCTGLKSITCEAITPPTCEDYVFSGVNKSIPVYVPAESVETYKTTNGWKEFTDIRAIGVPQEFVNPVKIGDLFFNLDTVSQTAELTHDTADFEHNYRTINGNIDIPASVEYLGVTYPVTRVGKAAFVYCSHFLSVTIPNSITSIGEDAFATVPNIVYNGTATGSPWGARSVNGYVEGYWVYSDRSRTSLLACSAAAKGEVNVYRTVIVIADEAIAWCDSLTVVNIPSSVSSIGDWAFAYSDNIEAINVASENTTFSSVDGVLFNKDQTSLIKYPGGKKGEYIVPNTVTTIKKYACFMSNGLTAVTISNRVQTIEEMAFWYCSNLESVTIGSSVTEIGNQTFDYCNRLTSVTCEAIVPPACGAGTFYSVDKSIPVYVPAIGVEAYKAANGWKDFTNIQPIQAEEIAVTDIQAEPTDNSVVIEWPKVDEATVYTIEIKKNGELICTLTFNELGQLLNIAFAAPSRNGNRDSAQPRMALQTTTGWQYTISGLEANTTYSYNVIAKRNASDTETLYNETITFTTKQTPTSVDAIQESSDTEVLKFIKNGQLLIRHDGKTYTVTGQEVK